jgi:drug/metabolite transporter (DMT)-like permease
MPDLGPFGSASPVVFGLTAAALWGTADFGGGLASRRTTLFGVILVSQVAGIAGAVLLAIARAEPLPAVLDIAWSVIGGLLAAVGIIGLYGALAVGRMSVVAPVTAVLAALVPVSFGIVTQGLPVASVVIGIALSILAVVLVSRVPGHSGKPPNASEAGSRSGLDLALVGGVGLGLFAVAISRVDPAIVFGPLAIVRVTEASAVALVAVALRRPAAISVALVPVVLIVGVLDMGGNAGFLFARQTGPLAVAATLSSLYPITTIVLAALLLRERLTLTHGLGIAAALAGIGLISSGSVGSA